jgi:VCBS repeat-containing protein
MKCHKPSYPGILHVKNRLFVLLASLALLPAARAADVTLAWDPSPDAGVASYRVHYGTITGIYTDLTNAGPATTLTIGGLLEGTTYYFVATAVGTNQLESDFSNEINYTVPIPANQPPSITVISDQIVDEDTVAGPVNFTVDDPESAAGTLTLAGTSSNPSLVPDGNISFGGSGAIRTITVTPLADASGTALITVAVSDGELSSTQQFTLTVNGVNDAPSLTAIGNQVIDEDGSAGPVNFTVSDEDSAAGSLILSGSSDNPALVPNENIVFGGTAANRTVSITPAANASGNAQITVTVSDGDLSAVRLFTVTVNSINDVPTITAIPNQIVDEDQAAGPLAFTVDDVETAASSLIIAAASTDKILIPEGNISFGGSGTERTITVTPAANQTGTAQVTVSVGDGTDTVTSSFTMTVNEINDTPTIAAIADQVIDEDTAAGPVNFTIDDSETAAGSLTLSGVSSDTTLVPNSNISFGGNGANRAVTVTPAADQFGSAQITVTVSDGDLTQDRTFNVTVTAVNDAPTLASLPDFNIPQDSSEQQVGLTGIASGSANEDQTLTITATSSDPGLVPDPTVTYSSPAGDGSLSFTPIAGQSGSCVMMVTVRDDGGTSNGGQDTIQRTFAINVTPPENTTPTITVIGDQTIDEDGVAGPIGFTVGDGETAEDSLTLTATSSDPGLVPEANILLGGSGANRTVTLTPTAEASGSAQITVAVSDGELTATRQFTLTVNSVNDLPTVTTIPNQSIDEDESTTALSLTVGDEETGPGSIIVSGTSGNPTLVPDSNITLGGSGPNRTVTVTPAPDQFGTAQITVIVSDGVDSVTSAFTLTVNSINDAPTLTGIANQTIDEDATAGPVSFQVGDVESEAGSLVLSGSSSDPTLVPEGNITFGGSGANRTVTLSPAADQFGSAQITITVGDGSLEASQTFTLVVNSVEDAPGAPLNLRVAQVSVE